MLAVRMCHIFLKCFLHQSYVGELGNLKAQLEWKTSSVCINKTLELYFIVKCEFSVTSTMVSSAINLVSSGRVCALQNKY